MNKQNINHYFRPVLVKSSILSWLLKMLPTAFGIIMAQSMSKIVDRATVGDTGSVLHFGSMLLLFTLGIKLLEMVLGTVFERQKAQSLHTCKMNLYHIFLSNPLRVLYASEHGSSIEKLNDDFDQVTDRILTLYPNLGTGIITAVAYFGVIAFQDAGIAAILVIMSLLQLIPPILFKKFFRINYDNCRDIEAQITDYTLGGLKGFATIRLYGLKDWWLKGLAEYHRKYAKIGNTSIYTNSAQVTLQNFIATILKYGTCVILGLLMLTGRSTLDICVQAIALSGGFFAAVKTIFEAIPGLAVADVAQSRLSEWLFANDSRTGTLTDNSITLSHVSHAFEQKTILNNASARFDADRIYLIKGENGIGKSTFFHLITGMLPCREGNIRVGAAAPENLGDSIFPQEIFYLPQEDASFAITPCKMYEMTAPDRISRIIEYAERFGLTRTQLYDTQISELSGGERKKVYLSLAFAMNPVFLLLDEPTNSLDEHSKNVLLDLLRQRKGGAVIITHEPLLDAAADAVYIIREGELKYEEI